MVLLIGRSFYQSDVTMKQQCTMEAVTVKKKKKMWESDVGFVISLSNISPLQSFPHCLTIMGLQQADRERLVTVNEGLSPRDRIHTTYTWRGNATDSPKDAHQVHPIIKTKGF